MTDPIADLDRRLCAHRRDPLGAIAMNTSAPTDRAKDLEIQKLRADVAELVEGAKVLANAADAVGVHYFDTDTLDPPVQDMQIATQAVRFLLAKHRA